MTTQKKKPNTTTLKKEHSTSSYSTREEALKHAPATQAGMQWGPVVLYAKPGTYKDEELRLDFINNTNQAGEPEHIIGMLRGVDKWGKRAGVTPTAPIYNDFYNDRRAATALAFDVLTNPAYFNRMLLAISPFNPLKPADRTPHIVHKMVSPAVTNTVDNRAAVYPTMSRMAGAKPIDEATRRKFLENKAARLDSLVAEDAWQKAYNVDLSGRPANSYKTDLELNELVAALSDTQGTTQGYYRAPVRVSGTPFLDASVFIRQPSNDRHRDGADAGSYLTDVWDTSISELGVPSPAGKLVGRYGANASWEKDAGKNALFMLPVDKNKRWLADKTEDMVALQEDYARRLANNEIPQVAYPIPKGKSKEDIQRAKNFVMINPIAGKAIANVENVKKKAWDKDHYIQATIRDRLIDPLDLGYGDYIKNGFRHITGAVNAIPGAVQWATSSPTISGEDNLVSPYVKNAKLAVQTATGTPGVFKVPQKVVTVATPAPAKPSSKPSIKSAPAKPSLTLKDIEAAINSRPQEEYIPYSELF